MGSSDKIVGASACAASAFIFIYYSTWALLTPFFEDSSSLLTLFPPHQWSIYLPASLLVAGISLIAAFFLKTSQKKAKAK